MSGDERSSARSLLLSVFSEYVLPHDRKVWTSALLHVTTALALHLAHVVRQRSGRRGDGARTSYRTRKAARPSSAD